MILSAGYGWAELRRDGVPVLDCDRPPRRYRSPRADLDGSVTIREAEAYCRRRPPARWEVEISSPLWSARWRRVAPGKWVVVEAGRGFA